MCAHKSLKNLQEPYKCTNHDDQRNRAANERKLVVSEEIAELREALGRRVDELQLPPDDVRAVWRVRRVEAVLEEALRTEIRARDDRAHFVSRTVDGGALQAPAPVWILR